ncbi:Uncharacterised protein [Mycobacteroides abscessus subsp. abscessus]|nr:Uncharacterised protein [Mycobacteroides abscessus subsp. abscessus]
MFIHLNAILHEILLQKVAVFAGSCEDIRKNDSLVLQFFRKGKMCRTVISLDIKVLAFFIQVNQRFGFFRKVIK